MIKAFVFPGQGAQFPGMGKDLYTNYSLAKEMFENANQILGYSITDIMFGEDADLLKETKITQPAIFLHSVISSKLLKEKFNPNYVAGHSLGEFSALVASGYIKFEDGLNLVQNRANAMQKQWLQLLVLKMKSLKKYVVILMKLLCQPITIAQDN